MNKTEERPVHKGWQGVQNLDRFRIRSDHYFSSNICFVSLNDSLLNRYRYIPLDR